MTKSFRAPVLARRALMASSALVAASLAFASPALAQDVSLNGVDETRTTLTGVTSVENGGDTDATLTVNLAADEVFTGVLTDGAGGGVLGLTKTGGAVLTLTGTSDYTGSALIESGGLAIDGGSLLTDAYIAVGQTGVATFDVINDASVLADSIYIYAGDTMTVENSSVQAGYVRVGFTNAPGDTGESSLTLDGAPSDGGWTLDADQLGLGHLGTGNSVLTLQNGARARVATRFVLGESNKADMTSIMSITNGLLQTEAEASVGQNLGSTAVATVTGANSRWSADSITVGEDGDGTLIVSDGAVVEGGVLNVGLNADGVGRLIIGGQGAAAAAGTVDFDTVAFGAGTGSLIFNHTGDEADDYIFAADVSGRGTLSADAGYTTLTGTTAFGQLLLNGGVLRVADGGSLYLADPSYVSTDGSPVLLLDGAPTIGDWTLDAAGVLNFNGGDGSLIVQNGATARIGDVNILGGDLISVTDGSLSVLGNITLQGAYGEAARMVVSGADSQASALDIALGSGSRLGVLTISDQALVTTPQIRLRSGSAILNIGAAEGEAPVAPGRLDAQNIVFSGAGTQIVFNHTGDLTIDANISGTGGLVTLLSGHTILSGDNTYTGETIFDGGTLALESDTALGASTLVVTGAFQEGEPTLAVVGGPRVLDNDIVFDRPDGLPYSAYLTVDSSDHGVTLNGQLTGSGTLRLEGDAGVTLTGYLDPMLLLQLSGLLRLESNLSFNDILASGGTLELGDGVNASPDITAFGELTLRTGVGESAVLDGSILLIDSLRFTTGNLTLNADIIDGGGAEGGVVYVTGGNITFGGDNEFTGGLNVSGGRAVLNSANALAAGNVLTLSNDGSVVANHALSLAGLAMSGATSLELNADVSITSADVHTIAGGISGLGGLAFDGGGRFILGGDNSYTGETILDDATLTLASDTALGGSTLRMTGSVLDFADGVNSAAPVIIDSETSQFQVLTGSATQSGVISEANGPRPFEKIGDGELVLTADNTWTGETTVSAGTLTFDGGSLDLVRNLVVSADGGSLARIVARGGAQISTDDLLIVGDTSDGELLIEDGAVVRSGTGFVGWRAGVTGIATITGGGSWDVGGLLSVGELGDGALTISEGATVISNHGKIGGASGVTGTVLVEGSGSLWTLLEPNIALEIGLVGSGSLTIADRGRVEVETVRIANHGSGDGVLNIGAAAGDDAVDAGVLDADQVIFGPGDGSIVFNHTDDNGYTFAADISGAGSVSALSGFTLFSGTHTYTGATTVSDAMLRIDGSLSNEGGLTVEDGGSLFGSGAIGGLTTVESGGSLAGATGLTLTFNDLVLQDGAVIDTVLFAPSETTLFDVAGDLTLDGTLNIADGGAFGQGVYRLFDYGGELYGDGLDIGDTGGANAAELTIQTADLGQVNLVYGGDLLFWDGAGPADDGLVQGGTGTWTATSENWTDANGDLNGAMTPQPGFAVFQGAGGTVTASDADGALSVTGMNFASDGYTLTGDAIALASPDAGAFAPSVLRVGDGTAAGVNMTAEIQNDLSASLGVVKTDLGELILSGVSVFDDALAVEGGGLTVRGGDVTTLGPLVVEGVGSESRLLVDGGGQVAAGGVSVGGDDGGAVLTVSGTGSRLDAGSLSIYGLGGGTVSVDSGGRLHATSVIDANGQSPATLLVTGAGSLVTGENALNLGTDSIGVMLVDDEGRVETVGGFLGLLDGAYGQATLQNGGVWAAEELFVGYMGEGHVQAFDGGSLQIATGDVGGNGSLELGSLSGGYGVLEVEGGFASIENMLWVGRAGDGIVDLGEDGVIQSDSAVIAEQADSISEATISGGQWTNAGAFVVGQAGWGTLYAEVGGSLITGDAVLGEEVDSLGMAVITDAATSWFINGGLTVGAEGNGELQVRDGAVVSGGVGRAGVEAGSFGEITVTGGGALNLDSLTLGEEGTGSLTLTDGGTLTLAGGTGVLTLGGSASNGAGLIIGGCCAYAPEAVGVLNAAEVVFGSGAGELYFNHTETDYTFAAELTGAGLVVALAGTTHLTGNSTDFTGQVFVAGADARLLVDGLLGGDPLSSLTVVSDGGRLGGSGTLDQYVAIDTGGILEGRSGQALTLGNLVLGADGVVEAALGAPSADVLFDVTGDLTLDGELEIVDLGGFGAGLYGLFGYGGTLTDNGLDIASAPGGVNLNDLSLQITGDRVNLINLAGQTITFWDGAGPADNGVVDGGDGLWTAVTENWTNAAGTVNGVMDPTPGFAVFSGSAGTVTLDDAAGALSVTGLQFAVDGYELTGDALTLAEDADGNRRAVVRVGDGTAAGAAMTATIHSDLVSDRLLLKTDLGELVLTGDVTLVDDLRIQNGTLTLDGGTSVTDDIRVGDEPGDDGVLIVRNGAQLSNQESEIGRDEGSRGEVTITGQGSVWNSEYILVGYFGDGVLNIADSGRVHAFGAMIAADADATGDVTVAGAGSEWASDDELYVGLLGDAVLTITDGATVSAADVIVASEAGSAGVINIGAAAGDEAESAGALDTATLSFGDGAGELVFNHTEADYGFAAAMSGAGVLRQMAGATRLTADSSGFTGNATVTGGALLVDGVLGGDVSVTGGSLGGSGSVLGTATIADGGVLSGVQGRTLGLGTLVLSEGSTVEVALGAADGSAALFDVAGDLTLDGELEVTDVGGFGAGVYRLFDYGGVLTDNGLDIALTPGVDPNDLLVQTSVANQVNLISTFDVELRFWDGSGPDYDGAIQGGDGTWSLTGRNWAGADGTLNGVYDNPAFAVFMGMGGTVTVDGSDIGVTGMQFAVDGYELTGDGIDLTEEDTIVRVGDGTAAGADMTATIASALTGAGGLVKTDLGVLILTGTNTYEGGTVVLDGTLIGDAGSIAGDVVNDAVLVFDQGADADFAGAISGDGEAFKRGAGVLSLLGGNAMDWSVETGGLLAQADVFAGDVDVSSGATFTLNAEENAAWNGALSGDGTFTKTGAGGLALNGNSSDFEGIAEISEGLLVLNGILGGELRVLDGAMLAGSGGLVELTAENGAVIAPGNSIGTLTVTGDVVFETGSIYEVEVDPTSDASDRIVAGGTATLNGGVVRHVGYPGDYGPESTYTILTAAGGVTGAFDAIETDFAFLDASLDYEADAVLMTLERNAVPFPAVGETFNQRSTGAAVEATQPGDPLYDAVVGQNADGARLAFDMLSGELHGSIRSAQSEAAQVLAGALTGRMDDARGIETGAAFWAQATGSRTRLATDGNAASLTHGAAGLMMGADAGFGAVRLGVAGGASAHDYDSHARAGQAEGDSLSLAAYGSGQWGALGLKGAVSGTWHEVETERLAAFPGFAEVLTADYDAETVHAFVEASWRVDMGPATTLEPFVNLARVRTESDAFTEAGGDAALAVQGRVQAANLATAGVGMSRAFDQGDGRTAVLSGRLGWRHAWGDTAGDGRHAFAGSPTPAGAFTVRGLPVTEDALVAELGLDLDLKDRLSLTVDWSGQLSSDINANALTGTLNWRF